MECSVSLGHKSETDPIHGAAFLVAERVDSVLVNSQQGDLTPKHFQSPNSNLNKKSMKSNCNPTQPFGISAGRLLVAKIWMKENPSLPLCLYFSLGAGSGPSGSNTEAADTNNMAK